MSITTMEQLGSVREGQSITIREGNSATGTVWTRTATGLLNPSGVELPIHFFSGAVSAGEVASGAAPAIEVGMGIGRLNERHFYLIVGIEAEGRPADNPALWVADFRTDTGAFHRLHQYSKVDFGDMPLHPIDNLPDWCTGAVRTMAVAMHNAAVSERAMAAQRDQAKTDLRRLRDRPYPDLNVEQFVTDLNAASQEVDSDALDNVLSSHAVMTPRRITRTAVVTGKAPVQMNYVSAGVSTHVTVTSEPPVVDWSITLSDRLRVTNRDCQCGSFDLNAYTARLPANRTDVEVKVTCTSPRCVNRTAA